MTMPSERTRAVLETREFLQWLMSAEANAEALMQAKQQARALLRHYPSSIDLHLAHLACPMWFGPSLERSGAMSPDEVERLVADLDSAKHDGQVEVPQGAGPAPLQKFSGVKQFDVRAWAESKGIKFPKR